MCKEFEFSNSKLLSSGVSVCSEEIKTHGDQYTEAIFGSFI